MTISFCKIAKKPTAQFRVRYALVCFYSSCSMAIAVVSEGEGSQLMSSDDLNRRTVWGPIEKKIDDFVW